MLHTLPVFLGGERPRSLLESDFLIGGDFAEAEHGKGAPRM